VSLMTKQYCTETVVNKGIVDIIRFQQEVARCVANPVTYRPPASRSASPAPRCSRLSSRSALPGRYFCDSFG
jgi:hypothetical protein